MRLLWIDAGQGAAGDMLLAALLDAGADEVAVRRGLAGIPVDGFVLHVEQVRRHGFRALRAHVEVPNGPAHRTLAGITALLEAAVLPPAVLSFATAVFQRLGHAEAEVHGIGLDEVHFHEVGALDAIVDIVGCALALDSLGFLQAEGPGTTARVSPVAVGSGSTLAAHGVLPVPAPAVLHLLRGAPVAAHHAEMELCTPTGAALLVTLADEWGPLPGCVPRRVGAGAGERDPATHPNILRVLIADLARPDAPSTYEQQLTVVETTVDDLDPRLWPDVLEAMRTVGAADAWCSPVLMRKGRPGHVLTVLVAPERADAVCQAVFAYTTTLGLRVHQVERRALARSETQMTHRGQQVSVKVGLLDGRVVTAQPEYDDARRAAEALGLPVRQILSEVTQRVASVTPDCGTQPDNPSDC